MTTKTAKCKVCGNKTNIVYNIKLKAVPICESCARSIAIQEINDLIHKANNPDDKE